MPELLHTAEVRWFFRGEGPEPPGQVQAWFRDGRPFAWPPPGRVDRYLRLPGCESTSIKVREGRFEVKVLRGSSETVRYRRGVAGRADAWSKWSYSGPAVVPLIADLGQEESGWLEVTKWRWLRKFSLDQSDPVEVEEEAQPNQGCELELTVVWAGANYWWTIGLEAFGPLQAVRANLHRAAGHLFSQSPPPFLLDTVQSCAYPIWLNGVDLP